jgi:hypothetical protein
MSEGQIESCNGDSWIPARTWLLFNTWFSSLVVCVSAACCLHVPIAKAAWTVVIFCFGLVIVLRITLPVSTAARGPDWRCLPATLLILGAVVTVLWGSLVNGEFVSVFPDPWSYSAFATYLQSPVTAISDGSQPVLSFGSALMGSRYATPGLLAVFADIAGTDACRSAGVFAFLVLCHIGFGFTLLARALRAGPILSLGAGLFGVTIGWAPEILKIGNWDQVLFVSLIPFAILRIRLSVFPTSRISGALGLGLCTAAALFAYPEGTAISGVIYLPLVVWRLFRGKRLLGKILRLTIACSVSILLSLVYLPTFVSFLFHQISTGGKELFAKGVEGGLLSTHWLPAVYCLGAQLPATTMRALPKLELIVAVLFLGLSFAAIATWWRRRDDILLTIPFFLALTLWQALLVQYDYGLYKVLTMFWPVMVVAIFVGMSELLAKRRGLVRLLAVCGFSGLMAGAVFDEVDNFQYAPWRHERRIQPFVELRKLKEISGDAPIRIQTENWFNQMWAVFFLRGYKIEVLNPLLYLKSSSTGLIKRETDQGTATFVLTDEKKPGVIWHNDIFFLLNRSEPVEVLSIDAPNNVETVKGEKFIWLDNQFAVLTIRSDADRRAFLVIPECWPGYSRPGDPKRTLILEANGETVEMPAEGSLKIPLTLQKGNNLVRLACKEHATIDRLPSGDSRTLLLGIKGFSVRAAD